MGHETSTREIGKADINASAPGAITISMHSSARCPQPAIVTESLLRLVRRVQSEHGLLLKPLRLILVTAELSKTVSYWQRELGLPEAGVSKQPEGVAAGKHMSWGNNQESARSIIILADYIATVVAENVPLANVIVVHEIGHVHDDFARGLVLGFPQSRTPPNLNDWPNIRAWLAELTWSEYAAESRAAGYLTAKDLNDFTSNDPVYLAGVHKRLRQLVWSYKLGHSNLSSLWQVSVTDMADSFANLGRAIARLPFAESREEAFVRLVDPSIEAACWKPVIERLARELNSLGANAYSEWGAEPLSGLEEVVALGFEAIGIFPTHDGKNLHVRVG